MQNQLHVVANAAVTFGGEGLAALHYAESVAHAGAITFLSKYFSGKVRASMGRGSFDPQAAPTRRNFLIELFNQYRFMQSLCKNKKFDLIHFHGMWNPFLAVAALVARMSEIPLVITPHGCLEPWALAFNNRKKWFALKIYQGAILRSASLFIATANQELESIRRLGLRQAIAVFPTGVDIERPPNLDSQKAVKTILLLSRVHPKKRLLDLVESWARVRRPASFIGATYGNRPQQVAGLAKYGIKVKCFGHGLGKRGRSCRRYTKDHPGFYRKPEFWGLGNGDAWLCAGQKPSNKSQSFEVPGAGGFLMTEQAAGLDNFYSIGDEICIFDGIPDLAGKAKHFIANAEERDRIAKAAHDRTGSEHTYEMRFSNLLEAAKQRMAAAQDKQHGIDFEKFDVIEKQHRTGLLLRMFKQVLQFPCVMIWGGRRGPRAARRLLFELSWRLAGRRTYAVSGWPGRLFCKES